MRIGKGIFCACCLVWAALSGGFSWCQENLLQDPGMENWSSVTVLTAWSKESNIITQENSVKHGGGSSVKLTRKSSNEGIYQEIAVIPGGVYTLRAWVFNVSDTVKAGVVISWYNAANGSLGYDGPVKANAVGEWQQAALTATAPANAVKARCRIRIYDKKDGPCYADDAEFFTDAPLSVLFQDCYAVFELGNAAVHWTTASETGTAGFSVLRSEQEDGPYQPVTTTLIPGLGNSSAGRRYVFRDLEAEPGIAYWYRIEEVETGGARKTVATVRAMPDDPGISPFSSELGCGYPNPFNPSATLRFCLSGEDADGSVSLGVYTLLGQEVKILIRGAARPGLQSAVWDGMDASGRDASCGTYLVLLRKGNGILGMKRIVKLK